MNYSIILPGIHLITMPSERNACDIELIFTTGGSYFEDLHERGRTHLLEHCMVSRTEDYTYEQLKEYLFNQNIALNAYTSPLSLGIEGRSHQTNAIDLLKIVLNTALKPNYVQDDILREKDIVLRELAERSGDPQYQLHFDTQREVFDSTSIENHEVIGSPQCVSDAQINDLVDIHTTHMKKSHIVILISGGFDEAQLTNYIRDFVGTHTVLNSRTYDQLETLNYHTVTRFIKDDAKQTVIHPLAHEHVEISCYIPANIQFETRGLRSIFQNLVLDFYGSLHQKLREEKGYIYSLQSHFALNAQRLIIQCSCKEEFVELIMEEITDHLLELTSLFDEAKFESYKSIISKKDEMLQDDPSYLVQHLYHTLRLYNTAEKHSDYIHHLRSITPKQYLEFCQSISDNVKQIKWVFVSKSPTIMRLGV